MIPSSIVVSDAMEPYFPIIYVNKVFESTTGYRADEVLGRNWEWTGWECCKSRLKSNKHDLFMFLYSLLIIARIGYTHGRYLVGNRSSEFHPEVRRVRRESSYIYENSCQLVEQMSRCIQLVQEYAHAEARKSPVVDGVVMRNPDGKEVRYPVLLTPNEKQMTREVCIAFRQGEHMIGPALHQYAFPFLCWGQILLKGGMLQVAIFTAQHAAYRLVYHIKEVDFKPPYCSSHLGVLKPQ